MTLLPSKEFGVRGHKGKPYEVNEICAVLNCGRASAHAHHLWPRSHLRSQPYDWVELPDGTVIGNRIGLCREHHEDVTGAIGGHKAWIEFSSGLFWWRERVLVNREPGPSWAAGWLLDTQPPGVKARDEGRVINPRPDTVCPTCGHEKRRRPQNGKPRKTKEWTLLVPDDAESGADVLDDWADDIALILGYSDETSRLRRYHAVATALFWVVQNREEFVRDLAAS